MKQVIFKVLSAKRLREILAVSVILIGATTWLLIARNIHAPSSVGKIVVAEVSQHAQGNGLSQVTGQVTNLDSGPHNVKLKVIFYGRDGGAVGRAMGEVANLLPQERRTFYLYTTTDIGGFVAFTAFAEPIN